MNFKKFEPAFASTESTGLTKQEWMVTMALQAILMRPDSANRDYDDLVEEAELAVEALLKRLYPPER